MITPTGNSSHNAHQSPQEKSRIKILVDEIAGIIESTQFPLKLIAAPKEDKKTLLKNTILNAPGYKSRDRLEFLEELVRELNESPEILTKDTDLSEILSELERNCRMKPSVTEDIREISLPIDESRAKNELRNLLKKTKIDYPCYGIFEQKPPPLIEVFDDRYSLEDNIIKVLLEADSHYKCQEDFIKSFPIRNLLPLLQKKL